MHGLVRFGEVLERRAREFQHTPQSAARNGVHAEAITFGLKIANWFAENRRTSIAFGHAARQLAVGKISGAVGNASHLGPEWKPPSASGLAWTWRRWRRR